MSVFFGKRLWMGLCSLVAISASSACAVPTGEATGEAGEAQRGGCHSNTQCGAGNYCAFPSGTDEMCGSTAGTCQAIPTLCTTEVVAGGLCGCDGNTYGNPCLAAKVGVSIAYEGACGAAGDLCGGPTDIACGSGLYCELAGGEACGSIGTCAAEPVRCTYVCPKTCVSCDGESFCNACLAAKAGKTVSSTSCP
jgi:hypothetical protein